MNSNFVKLTSLRNEDQLRARLAELDVHLPLSGSNPEDVLRAPLYLRDAAAGERTVGNRFAILPMEGWDGTPDGRPTELVQRRWRNFGESGAKLIWCEATAVRSDGRANPHQLVMDEGSTTPLGELRADLVRAHRERFGGDEDLVVGLQLTHSGRWSRPDGSARPRTAYSHPWLDGRVEAGASQVLSDAELDELVVAYVDAAVRARDAGFDFVDVKHCHGYLLHELLSATERSGEYGGVLAHRIHFLRAVVAGIRERAPELSIAVRLSAFDYAPFHKGADGRGVPETDQPYRFAFGGDGTGVGIDLAETHAFLSELEALGIGLVSITAGSPYYCPHVQRPAAYPPSDGYAPPEDPLIGVARMIAATAELALAHPSLAIVGSGLSYLQEWLPRVGAGAVEAGSMALVGLGRMALSYPDLPSDVLAGRELQRKRICRTFSDCTTAPRNGLISGCYPLDPHYKAMDAAPKVAEMRKAAAQRG